MNSIANVLAELQLVPDRREWLERTIDHYINWVTQDNPQSELTTKEMVELDSQIALFQQRKQELAQDCDRLMCERFDQFDRDVLTLQNTTPTVIRIGAPHQIQMREQQWFETRFNRLVTVRDQQLNVIQARYTALIQACDQWIDHAQARLSDIQHRLLNTQTLQQH